MTKDPFTKLRYSGEGIIRKWAEKEPENPEGWMRYGALLCVSHRWEESKEILKNALKLNPTGWVLEAVLYYLGISLKHPRCGWHNDVSLCLMGSSVRTNKFTYPFCQGFPLEFKRCNLSC